MRRFIERLLVRLGLRKPKAPEPPRSTYQREIGGRNPRRGGPKGRA